MDENKFEKKVNELCSEIYQKLSLLIDNDYILVDLPYHSNIGDVLIWKVNGSSLVSYLINVCIKRQCIHIRNQR